MWKKSWNPTSCLAGLEENLGWRDWQLCYHQNWLKLQILWGRDGFHKMIMEQQASGDTRGTVLCLPACSCKGGKMGMPWGSTAWPHVNLFVLPALLRTQQPLGGSIDHQISSSVRAKRGPSYCGKGINVLSITRDLHIQVFWKSPRNCQPGRKHCMWWALKYWTSWIYTGPVHAVFYKWRGNNAMHFFRMTFPKMHIPSRDQKLGWRFTWAEQAMEVSELHCDLASGFV